MNYVESLDILGVEAKEIPCIKGTNAPTSSTPGAVGVLYMTQSGALYKCVSAANGVYLWDPVGEVLPTRGSSEKATMSQKALTELFDKNDIDVANLQSEVAAAASKALRNDKRIANLEAGIPDDDFITDNSVAYVRDVPSNALPFAEITEIGGMTYKEGNVLRSASVYEVVSEGANLFDIDKRECGTIDDDGNLYITNLVGDFYRFDAEENTQYTLCDYVRNINTTGNGKLSVIYTDGSMDEVVLLNPNTEWAYRSFTTAAGKTVALIRTNFGDSGAWYIRGAELILNKGTTALPYRPYIKRTLTLPEAVRNLPDYGVGIPNTDYFNRIRWRYDEATDKWVREYDRPMKTTNLGTLNWQYGNLFGTGVYCFYAEGATDANNEGTYSIANILCHLYDATTANEIAQQGTTGIALYEKLIVICDTNYTDAATFKTAMSGVMLVYELATHEITDISHLLPEDNLIGVEGGGSMTPVNEHGYAVPMTITYQIEEEAV